MEGRGTWGIGTNRGLGFYPVGYRGLVVKNGLKWSCMPQIGARKGCLYKKPTRKLSHPRKLIICC